LCEACTNFAAISVFSTPYWGRLADRIGPRKARVSFSIAQTAGMALLIPFGGNLWLLMVPIFVGNVVGPAIDVTSEDVHTESLTLQPGAPP
jgi:MFS family permease